MNKENLWSFAKEHPIITFLIIDSIVGVIPRSIRAIKGNCNSSVTTVEIPKTETTTTE